MDSKGETGSTRPRRRKHASEASARSEPRPVEPVEPVEGHEPADNADLVDREVEYWLDPLDRTAERAREFDCRELVLEVDVSTERAVTSYEGLGFETCRRWMTVAVDDL